MPISVLIVQLGVKTEGSWAEMNNFLHCTYAQEFRSGALCELEFMSIPMKWREVSARIPAVI